MATPPSADAAYATAAGDAAASAGHRPSPATPPPGRPWLAHTVRRPGAVLQALSGHFRDADAVDVVLNHERWLELVQPARGPHQAHRSVSWTPVLGVFTHVTVLPWSAARAGSATAQSHVRALRSFAYAMRAFQADVGRFSPPHTTEGTRQLFLPRLRPLVTCTQELYGRDLLVGVSGVTHISNLKSTARALTVAGAGPRRLGGCVPPSVARPEPSVRVPPALQGDTGARERQQRAVARVC